MNTQSDPTRATLSVATAARIALTVIALAATAVGCKEKKGESDNGSDTGTATGWPTDTSTSSVTDTTSATETGTTTQTTETETPTGTTDGTATETETVACNDDSDCPAAPACKIMGCSDHQCVLGNLPDGGSCTSEAGECMVGSCLAGECANAAPVSGIPCSDDDNECTKDECRNGQCKHIAQPGQPCSDDNECTLDICASDGTCGISLNGEACTYDTDPCTRDECSNKQCIGVPINEGQSCDDGSWCNGTEICVLGTCTSTSPPCGSGTACSYYECTEPTGGALTGSCGALVKRTDGTPCDDGVFCNGPDECQDGDCLHGPVPCDGSSGGCTFEECDEELQDCIEVDQPDETPCPDEFMCNGTEMCIGGMCLLGLPYCPAINECQYEDCTENGDSPICADATFAENGSLCSVSDPCAGTGTHRCVDGICAYGEIAACLPEDQDNNFCTQWANCTPLGNSPSCQGLLDNAMFSNFGQGTDSNPSSVSQPFSTAAGRNDVSTYQAANCPGSFTGGEAIYKIPSEGAGISVEAEIVTDSSTNNTPLTLLLISNPCSPTTSCLQMTTTTMTFTVPVSGNYYLVVDGLSGNRGTGTITLRVL